MIMFLFRLDIRAIFRKNVVLKTKHVVRVLFLNKRNKIELIKRILTPTEDTIANLLLLGPPYIEYW